MKTYKPSELIFYLEEDSDFGWCAFITTKEYWDATGYINSTHFLIEGLESWGCGDMEATWLLFDKDKDEVKEKLIKLGMTNVK